MAEGKTDIFRFVMIKPTHYDVDGNVDEVTEFFMTYNIDHVHPQEGGVVRIRSRRDRRPGFPVVNPLIFYPVYWAETVAKLARYAWGYHSASRMHRRLHADPHKYDYMDIAITPQADEELEELALFCDTAGGQSAVAREITTGAVHRHAGTPAG